MLVIGGTSTDSGVLCTSYTPGPCRSLKLVSILLNAACFLFSLGFLCLAFTTTPTISYVFVCKVNTSDTSIPHLQNSNRREGDLSEAGILVYASTECA